MLDGEGEFAVHVFENKLIFGGSESLAVILTADFHHRGVAVDFDGHALVAGLVEIVGGYVEHELAFPAAAADVESLGAREVALHVVAVDNLGDGVAVVGVDVDGGIVGDIGERPCAVDLFFGVVGFVIVREIALACVGYDFKRAHLFFLGGDGDNIAVEHLRR